MRTMMALVAAGLAAVLGGCGTEQAAPANLGVMRPAAALGSGPVVTLGAGDALGRAIYLNDLVLASRGVKGAMPDYLTAKPGVTPAAIANAPETQNLPGE